MKHPMQNIHKDKHGTIRFVQNEIVNHLIDNGSINLNTLAKMDFSDEDRMQLSQLIGYSIGGYADLSHVSDESFFAADKIANCYRCDEEQKQINPKTSAKLTTTVQDLLLCTYGNKMAVTRLVKINRGTLDAMLADNRKHVVLIEDGKYTLLK